MTGITTRHIKVDRMRYSINEGNKYGVSISSIHPYDETEYHWAHLKPGRIIWKVMRDRHIVCYLAPKSRHNPLTLEEVARELQRLDDQRGLHRTGGIW